MTSNAGARLVEAKDRAWLGEVVALKESLKHRRQRQVDAMAVAAPNDLMTSR
jgi:hypothetical protein